MPQDGENNIDRILKGVQSLQGSNQKILTAVQQGVFSGPSIEKVLQQILANEQILADMLVIIGKQLTEIQQSLEPATAVTLTFVFGIPVPGA